MIFNEEFTRSKIFTKAYKEYHGGCIRITDETEKSISFEVRDLISEKMHVVYIRFDERHRVVKISCDCTIQALKCMHGVKQGILCSHIIDAVVYSMFHIGRRKGRPKIKKGEE